MHFLWSTLLVLTLSSSASSEWIDVPFVRQQEEGCGAASLSMLIQYWKSQGYSVDESASDPDRIFQLLYSKKDHGIPARDLTNYLRQQGFQTFEFTGKWEDLAHHLSKGRPLIASIEVKKNRLHYLLVTGIDSDQNLVLVNDPAERKLSRMTRTNFENRWKVTGNWTLLALPPNFQRDAEIPVSSAFNPESGGPKGSEYSAGIAEAKKGNYEIAKQFLESGWKKTGDDRFLPELAGVYYRLGDHKRAKDSLFQMLKRNPNDAYANHFLGTLFLFDGNMEACLKYWNRIGKPQIEEIQMRPIPHVDPEIMDHAIAIAPLSQLKLKDYLATESRFHTMDIFKRYQFRLRPYKGEEKFDLVLEPSVRTNSLSSKFKIAVLAGQAIFSETIRPEFHNIGGTTISSKSLISWDEYQNRFYTSLSLPLKKKPHQRMRFFNDFRKETWSLQTDLDVNRWEGGWEFDESLNSKIKWNAGTKASYSNYDTSISSSAFQEGWAMHVFAGFDSSLLRIPEKRIELSSASHVDLGSFFEGSSFVSFNQSLDFHWFPRVTGEDLAMNARFRAGKLFGEAPFQEYFVLGVERDSDLLLRGHESSIDKKGENPFSTAYLLLNWDVSKTLMERRFFRWRLAPFVDVARISNSEFWKGEDWFVDTGIQSGFQLLKSVEFIVTYGKDLRNGRNVFYFNAKL